MARTLTREHAESAVGPTAEPLGQADLLELNLHRPGTRRTVDPSLVIDEPVPWDVNVTVKLFDSPTYRELALLDGRLRTYLARTAVPLDLPLKTGTYLVPNELRQEVEDMLDTKLSQRRELQRKFLDEYPELREKFLDEHPKVEPGAAPMPFPEKAEIERAFEAEYNFTQWEDFVARLWNEATREAQRVLREQFVALMQSFARSLGRTESGRKRPVHESTVEQICHFLATYDRRSIVDDPALAASVAEAREIFQCSERKRFVEDMRKNDDRREMVYDQTDELVGEVRRIFVEKPAGGPDEHVH